MCRPRQVPVAGSLCLGKACAVLVFGCPGLVTGALTSGCCRIGAGLPRRDGPPGFGVGLQAGGSSIIARPKVLAARSAIADGQSFLLNSRSVTLPPFASRQGPLPFGSAFRRPFAARLSGARDAQAADLPRAEQRRCRRAPGPCARPYSSEDAKKIRDYDIFYVSLRACLHARPDSDIPAFAPSPRPGRLPPLTSHWRPAKAHVRFVQVVWLPRRRACQGPAICRDALNLSLYS